MLACVILLRYRWLLGLAAALVLLAAPLPAGAGPRKSPRRAGGKKRSKLDAAAARSQAKAKSRAEAKRKAAAGTLFAAGQRLYNAGRYGEAIKSFMRAQQLAPHPSSLFNIARCYENLSKPRDALRVYRQTLAISKDPLQKKDIAARIARLLRFPGQVFVSSQPPGARVTVDGRARPERKTTPLVVKVAPGEHVLLFRLDEHLLSARRVTVGVGGEATVHLVLEKRPKKPKPCVLCKPPPKCAKCADPRLLTFEGLHLHVSANGGFAIGKDLGIVGGPGVQVAATIGRIRVGALFQYLPVNPSTLDDLAGTNLRSTFMHGQVEGGYVFPFGRFQLYATAGVGIYLNRLVKQNTGTNLSESTETGGVIWSLGGGIESMATRWLSLGVGLRIGMMHGALVEAKPDPNKADVFLFNDIEGPFPIGMLWGSINFHL